MVWVVEFFLCKSSNSSEICLLSVVRSFVDTSRSGFLKDQEPRDWGGARAHQVEKKPVDQESYLERWQGGIGVQKSRSKNNNRERTDKPDEKVCLRNPSGFETQTEV
jgi:hypothetical protein